MRRILLINFGRMGDLLQTSPLITFLKEQNPQAEIGCLAASNFTETLEGIPDLDFLHPIDLMSYMLPLREGGLRRNFDLYRELLQELSDYEYDSIFNLTHNRLGAVLSGLLPGEVHGLVMDAEGFISVEDPWLRQFYNTNINRGLNQFNLVDLYRLAGGYKAHARTKANNRLRFNVKDDEQDWAEAALKRAGWREGQQIIGVQAGASTESKQWGAENFRRAAIELSQDFFLLFFGTDKEKSLVEAAGSGIAKSVNLAGETGVGQLAALLQRCRLQISNDTGTQHLAAAVDTPVLSLTLGPALASETGPFGEGHIIVEADAECAPCNYKRPCVDFACHSMLKPELVVWLAREIAAGRDISDIPPEYTSKVKISRTAFDHRGLWLMQPVVPGSNRFEHRVNLAYREAWWELYNSNEYSAINIDEIAGKEIADDSAGALRSLKSLIEFTESGIKLTGQLERSAKADKLELPEIKRFGAEIGRCDAEIEALGNARGELRPLTLDYHLGKEALPEAGLAELAQMTGKLYRQLKRGAELFAKHLARGADTAPIVENPPLRNGKPAPKRVLAVDAPYFVTGEMSRAFSELGAEVELVNLDPGAKDRLGGAEEFIAALLSRVDSFQPDFLFTVNHLGFDSEGYLVEELERRGVPSAVFYVDSPLLILSEPSRLVGEFNQIFCWDEYLVERMRSLGFPRVHYLPLAASVSHFYPRSPAEIPPEFKVPIAFVADSLAADIEKFRICLTPEMLDPTLGEKIELSLNGDGRLIYEALETARNGFNFDSSEQSRAFNAAWTKIINQKIRLKTLVELTELGLTVFGDEGWDALFDGRCPELRSPIAYFRELPLLYNGAAISFNYSSLQMPQGLNQRVFDVPACGGFLLTDHRPELEEIFEVDKDIAVYHSPEEARELAEYYLSRPELRKKMSASARTKVIANHTYKRRAKNILEKMSDSNSVQTFNAFQGEIDTVQSPKDTLLTVGKPDEIAAFEAEFPETLDVPREVSIHHFGPRSLVIAPENAAWIVTDEVGAGITASLAGGRTMGAAAAEAAARHGISAETALRKLREVIELMNLTKFRQGSETRFEDRDLAPRNLQLFLTRQCNLKCSHCYFSAGSRMKQELTTEEWKNLIKRFAFMGQGNSVTFTGGEPLIHPDFFEIAETAVNEGLKAALLTNGVLIQDRETASRIAGLADSVQVSLDGVSPDINDLIRGQGNHRKAVQAVKLLLEEKVEVEITCVVLPENVSDLERNLSRFIEAFDSPRLRCALAVANPKGRLKGGYREEAESLVGRVVTAIGDAPWLRQGRFVTGCRTFGCELAISIVVNPEGKIGSCPYQNYSGPGDVRAGEFAELAQKDRDWHREAMVKSEKCRKCDLRNFQCGGCRICGECKEQIKLRCYYRMLEGR